MSDDLSRRLRRWTWLLLGLALLLLAGLIALLTGLVEPAHVRGWLVREESGEARFLAASRAPETGLSDGDSTARLDGDASSASSDGRPGETAAREIRVHIAGAVRRPGVYRLGAEACVMDLVELAGGLTEDAAVERINLAAALHDHAMVLVPTRGSEPDASAAAPPGLIGLDATAPPASVPAGEQPLDLNRATAAELETLPGIGPVTARAIVELRDERGAFAQLEDLLDVPGIGERRLAQLRPRLQLLPP